MSGAETRCYFCSGASCPGLPYEASTIAHPASCAAPMPFADLASKERRTDKRQGPRLTLDASCNGCAHCHEKSYAVQGDSGFDVECAHPEAAEPGKRKRIGDTTWKTPAWCPLLSAAKVAKSAEIISELDRAHLSPESMDEALAKLEAAIRQSPTGRTNGPARAG